MRALSQNMQPVVYTDKKGVFTMSFNDIFKSNFIENVTSVSILDMGVALLLAFGLGMFIFLVYKKTYRGFFP